MLNPCYSTGLFLYPLKTLENLLFLIFSRGIKRLIKKTAWILRNITVHLLNKMHMNYVFQNFRMIIFHYQKALINFYNYFCSFASLCFNKNICRVSFLRISFCFFRSVLTTEGATRGGLLKRCS